MMSTPTPSATQAKPSRAVLRKLDHLGGVAGRLGPQGVAGAHLVLVEPTARATSAASAASVTPGVGLHVDVVVEALARGQEVEGVGRLTRMSPLALDAWPWP